MSIRYEYSIRFFLIRFDRFNQDQAWETGNGSTDGICFDVDTDGVVLCGVGVFGGGKKDHNYELMILEKVRNISTYFLLLPSVC